MPLILACVFKYENIDKKNANQAIKFLKKDDYLSKHNRLKINFNIQFETLKVV